MKHEFKRGVDPAYDGEKYVELWVGGEHVLVVYESELGATFVTEAFEGCSAEIRKWLAEEAWGSGVECEVEKDSPAFACGQGFSQQPILGCGEIEASK